MKELNRHSKTTNGSTKGQGQKAEFGTGLDRQPGAGMELPVSLGADKRAAPKEEDGSIPLPLHTLTPPWLHIKAYFNRPVCNTAAKANAEHTELERDILEGNLSR